MLVKKVCRLSLIALLVVQRLSHPLGGRYQLTPTEASVQKLPVQHGVTHTASVIAQGFNPYLAEWSPYHGAAYAVIEATARLVAAGSNWSKARFSYQEYFERMDKQAERFGQPVAALLGLSKLSFSLACHLSVGRTLCLVPLKN